MYNNSILAIDVFSLDIPVMSLYRLFIHSFERQCRCRVTERLVLTVEEVFLATYADTSLLEQKRTSIATIRKQLWKKNLTFWKIWIPMATGVVFCCSCNVPSCRNPSVLIFLLKSTVRLQCYSSCSCRTVGYNRSS